MERHQREREEVEKQQREDREREEARNLEDTQQDDILYIEETMPGKRPTPERSEIKIDTEGGGEANLIQAQKQTYDKHLFNRLG